MTFECKDCSFVSCASGAFCVGCILDHDLQHSKWAQGDSVPSASDVAVADKPSMAPTTQPEPKKNERKQPQLNQIFRKGDKICPYCENIIYKKSPTVEDIQRSQDGTEPPTRYEEHQCEDKSLDLIDFMIDFNKKVKERPDGK